MRPLTHLDILTLWENSASMQPLDCGLAALAQVCGQTWEELADWPFGRRNQALLELLGNNFNDTLSGWVPCKQCMEKLEFSVGCNALLDGTQPVAYIDVDGLRFRPPSSRALAAVLAEPEAESCVSKLLELCAFESSTVARLSPAQREHIGSLLAEADPLAYPTLAFTCVACGHSWDEVLDPLRFVRAEVEARARRLLQDVHRLARAYGWSEETVFALSDTRRAAYLEMVQA